MTLAHGSALLFRCDASPAIGGGHVMRCLTLANHLAEKGCLIRFACTAETVRTVSALATSGFEIVELADPLDPAELTACVPAPVEAAILDHYGTDIAYERAMRSIARITMAIDDLADRPHECDFILNQNFGVAASDYTGLIPAGSKVLAGAQFALLRPEFARARPEALARRARQSRVESILISMGLTDVGGITAKVLEATVEADTGAMIEVVVGSRAPSLDRIKTIASRRSDISVHVDTADMPALMTAADLAIGAAGSTSWERCCLGLPTITMVLAENQRNVVRSLASAGVLAQASSVEEVRSQVTQLCTSPEARQAMAMAAEAVTDGKGAGRVVRCLDERPENRLELRPATMQDAESLWKWRNDTGTREASGSVDVIAWPSHVSWLRDHLMRDDTRILIAEEDALPVGMVRFDRAQHDAAVVSINLDPAMRSKGLGGQILSLGRRFVRDSGFATKLLAHVRPENTASCRLFRRQGFEIKGSDGEMLVFEMPINTLPKV